MSKSQVYRRLLDYVIPYRGRFVVAILCTVVVGALNAVPALLVRYAVDDVLIGKNMSIAFYLAAGIVLVYMAKAILAYGQNYLMYWVGQRVVMDVRNELHNHFIRLPLGFFDEKATGELMAKITFDISLMQKAASNAIRDMGRHFFTFLSLLGVALYQNPWMTFIAVVAVPPVGYLIAGLGEKIRRITRGTQERMGDISSLMKETYDGMRVVKTFGAEDYEEQRFARANLSFFRTVMKALRLRALGPPLVEVTGGVLGGLVLWYGASLVIRGELTAGQLSSFLVALGMLYSPLKAFARVYNTLMEGVAGAQAVFEMMDNHAPEVIVPSGHQMGRLSKSIRFEGVDFSYGESPVLKGVDLEVPAGSIFALVGMSGAGKTTLLDVIPRFYIPTAGRIIYDGVDGAEIDLASLRKQIASVSQQIVLFSGTVTQNIAYAMNGAVDMAAVEAAARLAHAHEFISRLPHGYDTPIGEDGARLSGGERQRLAIARAVLRNPSILLLDEATSALDAESEQLIQDALNRLMRDRTTIVVAHRLSTVRAADAIAVLQEGRIVSQGKHAELMSAGGLYKKLYEMQFSTEQPPSPGLGSS
ncbi:MAG: ABC transporter ATP-binding protein [bacterium]|nr:ABC transporter ATP-binding protein [bacterium]